MAQSKIPRNKEPSKKELQEKIKDLEDREKAKLREITAICEAEDAAKKADGRAGQLARETHELRREIEALRQQLNQANDQSNRYSEALREKGLTIVALRKQLDEAGNKGDARKDTEIKSLKRKNEDLQKENKNQKAAHEAEMKTKNNKLAEAQKERNDAISERDEAVSWQDKYKSERDNYKEALGRMTNQKLDADKIKEALARVVDSQRKYKEIIAKYKGTLQQIMERSGLTWAAVETFIKGLVIKAIYRDDVDTKYAYPTTEAEFILLAVLHDTRLYAKLLDATTGRKTRYFFIHHNPRGKEDMAAYGKPRGNGRPLQAHLGRGTHWEVPQRQGRRAAGRGGRRALASQRARWRRRRGGGVGAWWSWGWG